MLFTFFNVFFILGNVFFIYAGNQPPTLTEYLQLDAKWVPATVQWCFEARQQGRYDSFHLWITHVGGRKNWV